MSDNEPDTEHTENPSKKEREPTLIEDLPNLYLSGKVGIIQDSDIEGQQRSRGILSKTDREYLLGVKNYENKQSEANRRQDIRNRVRNTLLDFKIIWTMLEEHDRNQIFTSLDDYVVDDSIEAMISFIYLGLDRDIPRMEKAINRGILAGEKVSSKGETKEVDVSINIDYYPDVEDVKDKVQNNPLVELTVEEIGVLAKANELDQSHIDKMNNPDVHMLPADASSPKNKSKVDEQTSGSDGEEPLEDSDSNLDDS